MSGEYICKCMLVLNSIPFLNGCLLVLVTTQERQAMIQDTNKCLISKYNHFCSCQYMLHFVFVLTRLQIFCITVCAVSVNMQRRIKTFSGYLETIHTAGLQILNYICIAYRTYGDLHGLIVYYKIRGMCCRLSELTEYIMKLTGYN